MDVPDKIINKDLYIKVRNEIKMKYPKHSAYRSMMIIKEYKNKDGKIKEDKKSGLNRWLDEKWINVYAYLKEGKKIPCGSKTYEHKSSCRPLIKVSKDTPMTIDELIKLHGKEKLLNAISKKNRDPQNLILQWKTLRIIKKK